ncbi:MAG TPA: hypothetical protein PLN21_04760 [Gemmatales bacterium]|nr:hypothetical protein [Gemmatales bacterium]
MFRHRHLLLISLTLAASSGCIIVPVPYLHPSFIPAQEVPAGDDILVVKITQRETYTAVGFPCIPYQCKDRAIELVPIEDGHLPAQIQAKPECFLGYFGISMVIIPLPGYRWDHDTISLRVYRRGHQTQTLKSWEWSDLSWKPASGWEERELAIDQIFCADSSEKWMENIECQNWFSEKSSWVEVENSLAVKTRIQQSLLRIALEYLRLEEELNQTPDHDLQLQRVQSKRKQLLCLASASLTKPGESFWGSTTQAACTEEVAIGAAVDIQQAQERLQANGIASAVVLKDSIYLYVPKEDFNAASALLLTYESRKSVRLIIRSPRVSE